MKTIAITIALLAGLPLAASAQVSKEDIKKLTTAGISDDVILSYVKANGGIAKLSAEDLVDLKKAGASEKLLSSVLSVSSTPAPEPKPSVTERQAYTAPAPAPATYVYDSTPYYYTPSSAYYADYYYPRSYYYPSVYYSSCYPRSSYYYSSCYPRSYYSSGLSIGISTGRYYGGRGYIGVSGYRRH